MMQRLSASRPAWNTTAWPQQVYVISNKYTKKCKNTGTILCLSSLVVGLNEQQQFHQ